jgi:hypothetical protein
VVFHLDLPSLPLAVRFCAYGTTGFAQRGGAVERGGKTDVGATPEGPMRSSAIIFYNRRATCWNPRVKGLTLMVNSLFNGWRMEDVWLDQRIFKGQTQ